MIVAKNISKNFHGTKAVNDISFEIKKGQTLVLLGTSGCGKTTTLKMLNRLIEPSSGEIYIGEQNIRDASPELLRRNIGYVSQHNGLFPHYTVAENVAIVPKLLNWKPDKIKETSAVMLDRLQLPFGTYANKFPDELSGGQKQRVALARALAANPQVLLMDEPFGALDPVTRGEIRKEFKEVTESDQNTIVLVTHDVQEAFEMGDIICLMDKGKIVQTGPPQELIFNPINDFVKDFFGKQRFQLELSSLTFGDIWNYLEELPGLESADLDVSQTLWEGMELLSTTNKEFLAVRKYGDYKLASVAAINASYVRFKREKIVGNTR